MKKIEIDKGISQHNHDRSKKNARRIRSGKVGGYDKYLDNQDVDFINTECKKLLTFQSKELINSFIKK